MKHLKHLTLILFSTLIFLSSTAQENKLSTNKFQFSELTFHSNSCNGTCPDISLSINNNRKIQLVRVLYIAKGHPDSSLSGSFKGTVKSKDFNKLTRILKKCNFDSIKSPEILCCDSSIKTIIVSYNGKYKRFKSIILSHELNDLITFLTHLATTISLPKHTGAIDFEE